MPSIRYRNCCFTWNNFPEDAEEQLRALPFKYCVYQEEMGESGTPHLQGYFELKKQMAKGKCQKLIKGWHIESRKSSQYQAIAYCTKKETRSGEKVEWGEKANQGNRTDIAGMFEAIRSGKRDRDIAEEMPTTYGKYYRAADRYRGLVDYDETLKFRTVQVDVYWGNAGTGKTRKAVEEAEGDYYILNAPSSNGIVWWNGYQGQKTLIIDDFYGWIKYSNLLRILDGYQMRLEIKGSFTYAKWEHVVITSNKQVCDWYPNVGDLSALNRRIDDTTKIE